MGYATLRFETEQVHNTAVARITLNRPDVRNAIDQAMVTELHAVLDELETQDHVGALIVTGAGDRAFAAGADIQELKERGQADALRRINAALFRRLEEQAIPSIAAVRGYALGGGCELAMACCLRIAGRSARFGQPEVGLGILPGAGALQRLPRLVGLGRARELIYTGRIIDAEEAERIGLVNRVVEEDEVDSAALELASEIARQGRLAVRMAKLALHAAQRPNSAFETVDVLAQAVLFESDEKQVRMQAFLDRKQRKASKP